MRTAKRPSICLLRLIQREIQVGSAFASLWAAEKRLLLRNKLMRKYICETAAFCSTGHICTWLRVAVKLKYVFG